MAFNISDYLVTDETTILLGLIAATVFLLHNLYRPQPLVHPILLGRQSDVARVRNPGESAVYRNYSTGMMGRVRTRISFPVSHLFDLCILIVPVAAGEGRPYFSRFFETRLRCSPNPLVYQSIYCLFTVMQQTSYTLIDQ